MSKPNKTAPKIETGITPLLEKGTDNANYVPRWNKAENGEKAVIISLHGGEFQPKTDAKTGEQLFIDGMPQFEAAPTSLKVRIGHGELATARTQIVISPNEPAKVVAGGVAVTLKITSGSFPKDVTDATPFLAKSEGYFRFGSEKGSRGGNLSSGAFVRFVVPMETVKARRLVNNGTIKFNEGLMDDPANPGFVLSKGRIWVDQPVVKAEGSAVASPAKTEPVREPDMAS